MPEQTPAIVLVHGAFAESASWSAVIEELQSRGLEVVAAATAPGVDQPAPHRTRGRRERGLGEVVRQWHLGAEVLQSHPVLAGGVRQLR
jgi:alpha-beta hydrolase superfamily lysophospholipase